jgi:hypothetical protein
MHQPASIQQPAQELVLGTPLNMPVPVQPGAAGSRPQAVSRNTGSQPAVRLQMPSSSKPAEPRLARTISASTRYATQAAPSGAQGGTTAVPMADQAGPELRMPNSMETVLR